MAERDPAKQLSLQTTLQGLKKISTAYKKFEERILAGTYRKNKTQREKNIKELKKLSRRLTKKVAKVNSKQGKTNLAKINKINKLLPILEDETNVEANVNNILNQHVGSPRQIHPPLTHRNTTRRKNNNSDEIPELATPFSNVPLCQNMEGTNIRPQHKDTNQWEDLPESEIIRLYNSLKGHLRKMKESAKKEEEEKIMKFIKDLLEKQNNTCAFGKSVKGIYCWNKPGDWEKKYLKLEWGHIKPRCRKGQTQTINDLCLLCARCNNQIQTSRFLYQLKPELESKIENIDDLMRS